MTRQRIFLAFFALVFVWLAGCASPGGRLVIVCPQDASDVEVRAAREVQRCVSEWIGSQARIIDDPSAANRWTDLIVVASKERQLIRQMTADYQEQPEAALLDAGQYLLKTIDENGRRMLLVIGGDSAGTLSGAHRLCERLEAYYSRDDGGVSDALVRKRLPELNERAGPTSKPCGIR